MDVEDGGMVAAPDTILYKPIGVIRTPFRQPKGTPIQPTGGRDVQGTVEVLPEYAEGLQDLEGFSHLVLVYHLHLTKGFSLRLKPFLDKEERGVFATRAPARPNPIGISIVRLDSVEGNVLHVRDLDVVDGTPLLDIKPHFKELDSPVPNRSGWLDERLGALEGSRDDGRFTE